MATAGRPQHFPPLGPRPEFFVSVVRELEAESKDLPQLYHAWILTGNIKELLWSELIDQDDKFRRKLTIFWLFYQVFEEYGKLDQKQENQLMTYLTAESNKQLQSLQDRYWRLDRKQRKKYWQDVGITLPELVDVKAKFLAVGLKINIRSLTAEPKRVFRRLSKAKELTDVLHYWLKIQLEEQGFCFVVPRFLVKPGEEMINLRFDLRVETKEAPPMILARQVYLTVPKSVNLDLIDLQKQLLAEWALRRFYWQVLKLRGKLDEKLVTELSADTELTNILLQVKKEDLYGKLTEHRSDMAKLLASEMSQILIARLYQNCNHKQTAIIKTMQPSILLQAALLNPESKACKIFLAKHFRHDHPYYLEMLPE